VIVHRRGDADHWHRDGDGMGTDAVGFLAVAGGDDGVGAGRQAGLPRDHSGDVRDPRQRAGGDPAIVLFGPLLFPVVKAIGVHEVHYALVIILAMGIGLFVPPFGV
jgi:hypothetical protein